jgi:hypothetical protein
MMKINSIWDELEKDGSFSQGLLLRRYSPLVVQDAYVALRQPQKIRCIAISINKDHPIDISGYSNLKDIQLELMPNDQNRSKKLLLILLVNKQHQDVFGSLCEDLMTGIAHLSDEGKFIHELLNRFQKWKLLFEKAFIQGLSLEEQRGIYGELFFLRKWLQRSENMHRAVHAWRGPEKDIRDFQISDWGVEIKTTHGNNHQRIHISSERQLDTSTLDHLFLLHISIDQQQQNGETLNQIVDSVDKFLSGDLLAQSLFRSKLLLTGYFNTHRHLYDVYGFKIRQETCYEVKDDFPRIEEKDVPRGVGDVQYSIILSEYKKFIITESLLFETIN